MSDKTKQHYVPKFYLKNFANGKLFNVHNIINGIIKDIPYNSQCYKNNFYGKDNIYETKLSELESKWAVVLQQILVTNYNLNEDEEYLLKQFCCFQFFRTEVSHIRTRNSYYEMAKGMLPFLAQGEGMNLSAKEINRIAYDYINKNEKTEETMKMLLDNAEKLSIRLSNLELVILENISSINFVTSDNPAIIGNEYQHSTGLGFDCIGFYLLLPISPRFYICLVDSKINYKFKNKKKIDVSKEFVKNLNEIQFHNSLENVYSVSIDELIELEKYINNSIPLAKAFLLKQYNDKNNNYLSNNEKQKWNDTFRVLLEHTNKKLLEIFHKRSPRTIKSDLFEICELSKPFADKMNYNFHRSASLQEMQDRIMFMKFCSGNEMKKIIGNKKKNSSDIKLVEKFEQFLIKYFTNGL